MQRGGSAERRSWSRPSWNGRETSKEYRSQGDFDRLLSEGPTLFVRIEDRVTDLRGPDLMKRQESFRWRVEPRNIVRSRGWSCPSLIAGMILLATVAGHGAGRLSAAEPDPEAIK